jgi:hypothetical protein
MDCRNLGYMDEKDIHGTGYRVPGRYDGLVKCVYNDERSAWKR